MKFSTLIIFFIFLISNTLFGNFGADFEAGIAKTSYNDIRIPGDTGTDLSLKDDLKDESFIFYRLRLNYTAWEKHTFSLLYAPLKVESNGKFDEDKKYRDVTFLADTPTEAVYQFNSYRLTYRYEWIQKEKFDLGIGFTAKIRDAFIEIKQEVIEEPEVKKNLGFVPIINFRFAYRFNESFGFFCEGDALAAPQGRAEDVLAALTYRVSDNYRFKAGYRILEGGADNDEVYTFSLFNYLVLGFIAEF